MNMETRVTIIFEEPFWIGIFERSVDAEYEVAKYVFGREPKDVEVYQLIIEGYTKIRFSTPIKGEKQTTKKVNPKKLKKCISREVNQQYMGTKAQQALKQMHEEGKEARQTKHKVLKEAEAQRKFELKQAKKKLKHRGH